MRCRIGPKKVERLRKRLGMPNIAGALCRGGTGHRIDLLMDDMSIICLYPDGTTEPSSVHWTRGSVKEEDHIGTAWREKGYSV